MRSSARSVALVFALGSFAAACAVDGTPDGASGTSELALAAPLPTGTGTGIVAAGGSLAPPDPIVPVTRQLGAGPDWQHVGVVGTVLDANGAPQKVDGEYFVINGRAALAGSGLPARSKDAIAQSVSAEPAAAGDDEIIIVPQSSIDAIEANGKTTAWSICPSDSHGTQSKTVSIDKQYSYTKGAESGAFTGSATFDASAKGTAVASVKYTVAHTLCVIPYLVLNKVSVSGDADVTAHAKVDGSFQKTWSYATTVAEPTIATFTLPVIPLPVTITLPVEVGLDAAAKAELHADATYDAHGYFSIDCTKSGCSGYQTGTHGFTPNGSPTMSVTGDVKVTPWAQASLKAKIIADSVAMAKVGVRASLPTELWAYAGNGCGDADNNGTPEWVTGAAIDARVDLAVRADTEFLGSTHGPYVYDVLNTHVGFWILDDGGAFDPMFSAGSLPMNGLARGRMRPCWPWTDAISYRIAWNDGATNDLSDPPATSFMQSHPYPTIGWESVTMTATSDAAGRTLNKSATKSFFVRPMIDPGPIGLGQFQNVTP